MNEQKQISFDPGDLIKSRINVNNNYAIVLDTNIGSDVSSYFPDAFMDVLVTEYTSFVIMYTSERFNYAMIRNKDWRKLA